MYIRQATARNNTMIAQLAALALSSPQQLTFEIKETNWWYNGATQNVTATITVTNDVFPCEQRVFAYASAAIECDNQTSTFVRRFHAVSDFHVSVIPQPWEPSTGGDPRMWAEVDANCPTYTNWRPMKIDADLSRSYIAQVFSDVFTGNVAPCAAKYAQHLTIEARADWVNASYCTLTFGPQFFTMPVAAITPASGFLTCATGASTTTTQTTGTTTTTNEEQKIQAMINKQSDKDRKHTNNWGYTLLALALVAGTVASCACYKAVYATATSFTTLLS